MADFIDHVPIINFEKRIKGVKIVDKTFVEYFSMSNIAIA